MTASSYSKTDNNPTKQKRKQEKQLSLLLVLCCRERVKSSILWQEFNRPINAHKRKKSGKNKFIVGQQTLESTLTLLDREDICMQGVHRLNSKYYDFQPNKNKSKFN